MGVAMCVGMDVCGCGCMWVWMCLGELGERDIFSDMIICITDIYIFNTACLFIIISLSAFDIALMYFLHVLKKY